MLIVLPKIPVLGKPMRDKLKKEAETLGGIQGDDFVESLGFRYVETKWRGIRDQRLSAALKPGVKAINSDLISFKTKTPVRLFDFMMKGRPLVLNFGSCT